MKDVHEGFGQTIPLNLELRKAPGLGNSLPVVPVTRGAKGEIVTAHNLPIHSQRWVVGRKAAVIAAIRAGVLSREKALKRYGITEYEFQEWSARLDSEGLLGLRTSRNGPKRSSHEGRRWHTQTRSMYFEIADVTVNGAMCSISAGGVVKALTPAEIIILSLLKDRQDTVLSTSELMAALYGTELRTKKVVHVFMCRLRKCLSEVGTAVTIKTVWGRGYMLDTSGS